MVLGVRADDMAVADAGRGDIDVTIYAFENTGEATLLTVQWGHTSMCIARTTKPSSSIRKDMDSFILIQGSKKLYF